jgi:effector protein B
MLIYKKKVLTQFKSKQGGKNLGGFYRDSDGAAFFVKNPNDPKELFTELFAGLLLQEFMRRGLIDKIYHASLICADYIQFEDGSYGLIQPMISFKELYKIIGTGYRDGSDRDPLVEMFRGPQFYLLLTQLKQYYGLATALMFSLLLGDNSVHSGNVVCLDVISSTEMTFIQFARIDWGAAFRYFGHKKNNDQLLNPFEYQGWFNHKGYTKGYFLNYKKIKGLFPAIAEQASILQKKIDEELLVEMVCCVLRQLPKDIVDSKTQIELVKYLCIESFSNISFGLSGFFQQFAHDVAAILSTRLKKITALQDVTISLAESDLSQIMYAESIPTAITLPINRVTPFAEQITIWFNILSSSNERSIFDFNSIERDKLAQQFNFFVDSLIRQMGRLNQYLDNDYNHSADQSCTEGSFLRCLFILERDLTPHPSSYNEGKRSYRHACWKVVEALLTASFNAIVTIRILQNTQNSTQYAKESAIHLLFHILKEQLEAINVAYQVFTKELEEILFLMSGRQLAKICVDEVEFMSSSVIIGTVLKNPVLWAFMSKAFHEEYQILKYQQIGGREMILKIEEIRLGNSKAIIEKINELTVINYDTVSKLLPKLLVEGTLTLDHSVYTPLDPTTIKANGIGRYLVYDHPDKTDPFSIWVFAFAPRQKTPIHDHKYKGTVTVLDGPISEKYYRPTERNLAQLAGRSDRYRFHSNRDDLTGTFVHQLKRRKGLGDGTSVTLHIYDMEAHVISLDGNIVDRRNLDQIYFKEKNIDKSSIPSYQGEYPDYKSQTYSM